MADVVSRIKIEAQGADQAAREIRKLKEAYREVEAAAKGLSPEKVGGGDPFSQATTPPSRQTEGEINNREDRKRRHDEQVRERELRHIQSKTMAGFQGGIQGLESVGAGQPVGALGGAARTVGGMVGVGGIGLALAGAGLFAAQRLANNEYERIQQLWGSGVSQRMGADYDTIREWQKNMGIEGIPIEQINEFLNAAGPAGIGANRSGAGRAASIALEAAAQLGVAPSQSAGFLGVLTRAGLNTNTFGATPYSIARGTFGTENIGRYLQELTQALESASSKGIPLTADRIAMQQGFMAALGGPGGLSITGAAGAMGALQARGEAAAGLRTPEDIIAFQALREQTGGGIVETLRLMESDPMRVNRAVFDYLERATGGNDEALFLRFKDFLGTGANATYEIIQELRRTAGMSPQDLQDFYAAKGGGDDTSWVPVDIARRATSVKQFRALDNLEKSMHALNVTLGEMLRDVMHGEVSLNALNVTFAGRTGYNFPFGQIPEGPGQDAYAFGQQLIHDAETKETALGFLSILSKDSRSVTAFRELQGGISGGVGDVNYWMDEVMSEIVTEARSAKRGMPRDEQRALEGAIGTIVDRFWGTAPSGETVQARWEEAVRQMTEMVAELRKMGAFPVPTDGDE